MIAIATNASAFAWKRSNTSACARKKRWTKLFALRSSGLIEGRCDLIPPKMPSYYR